MTKYGSLVLLLIGALIGISRERQYQNYLHQQIIPLKLDKETAVVTAPQDRRDGYGYLTVRLLSPPGGKLRLSITPYERYLPGDLIQVSGTVITPEMIGEDGKKFDYPRYLNRYGITKIIKWPTITLTGEREDRFTLLRALTVRREKLERQINRLAPEPEAGFLAGLLLGARRSMSEATLTNLTVTGTVHIIAVSGANVVFITDILLHFTRFLTRNRWWSFWLTLGAIFGFVGLTGVSAAAVRGGLVASITLIAAHTARGKQTISLLILPAALTLLANPYFKYDIGWQFSFAAFSGIILATPHLDQLTNRFTRLPSFVIKPLGETVSAQILLTPFLLYHLNALSLSSFIVNPLILGMVPFATVTGAGALLISTFISPPWLRFLVWLPLHVIISIINLGARLPWYLDWS